MDIKFVWDDKKDKTNQEKHGLRLIRGAEVFFDENRMDFPDKRKDYGEERRICIGKCKLGIISVCYTIRNNKIRLISVRPSSKEERGLYNGN
jgi:hypothetical protein